MQIRMNRLDWNHARAFLATAEAGSLSAAARRLGLTQPTLSRQVAALETELGVTLFERVGKRLVLTQTGAALLPHLRAMGQAADAATLAAAGWTEETAGRVSVSATDAYAAFLMPEIAARIRRDAPQITLSIISSDSLSDLRRREADIAIRHIRPEGEGLVARLVGEGTAGFYASSGWLSRNALPASPAGIAPGDLLGYEDMNGFVSFMAELGVDAAATRLRLLSSNAVVIWELARRGLGISLMIDEIGQRTPDMLRLFPDFPTPRFPVWLVAHRELRTSRPIRLVFDILAEELARIIGAPPPEPGLPDTIT